MANPSFNRFDLLIWDTYPNTPQVLNRF